MTVAEALRSWARILAVTNSLLVGSEVHGSMESIYIGFTCTAPGFSVMVTLLLARQCKRVCCPEKAGADPPRLLVQKVVFGAGLEVVDLQQRAVGHANLPTDNVDRHTLIHSAHAYDKARSRGSAPSLMPAEPRVEDRPEAVAK